MQKSSLLPSVQAGTTLAAILALTAIAGSSHAQTVNPALSSTTTLASFTVGDFVVSRVGTGSAVTGSNITTNTNGTNGNSGASDAVFLDEYTSTGSYVGSFALPTGSTSITESNAATSEGALSLSANSTGAQALTIAGYQAAVGVASIAGTTATNDPREVDVVSNSGGSTFVTQVGDYSANNIRSGVSTNGSGTTIYAAGANTGIVASSTGTTPASPTIVSTTVTNDRVTKIFNGNVYFSTGSGSTTGIYQINGEPTTAGTNTATSFLSLGASTQSPAPSPYDFYITPASTGGAETIYLADSTAGLEKFYSATGAAGSFSLESTIAETNLTGITGSTSAAGVTTLYGVADAVTGASSKTSTGSVTNQVDNNSIFSFVDGNTYSTGVIGAGTTLVTETSAADGSNNYEFRGIDFAPSAGTSGVTASPEPSQLAALVLFAAGLGMTILRRRAKLSAAA